VNQPIPNADGIFPPVGHDIAEDGPPGEATPAWQLTTYSCFGNTPALYFTLIDKSMAVMC
jgi:hypothetical protein